MSAFVKTIVISAGVFLSLRRFRTPGGLATLACGSRGPYGSRHFTGREPFRLQARAGVGCAQCLRCLLVRASHRWQITSRRVADGGVLLHDSAAVPPHGNRKDGVANAADDGKGASLTTFDAARSRDAGARARGWPKLAPTLPVQDPPGRIPSLFTPISWTYAPGQTVALHRAYH